MASPISKSLRSVRFDGERGYAVTFQQVDPLFVLDLSDPANPLVAGELEVPGYSTHMVPLGDRLVAVGFDDTAGIRPAVALYDVADPSEPRQLERVALADTGHVEIAFQNEAQDLGLGGLLFVPEGDGPFPAAVVIHGSGTSHRDNGWYLTLTKHLQDNGIVVLLPD